MQKGLGGHMSTLGVLTALLRVSCFLCKFAAAMAICLLGWVNVIKQETVLTHRDGEIFKPVCEEDKKFWADVRTKARKRAVLC